MMFDSLWKAWQGFRRFSALSIQNKPIVFYAEDSSSWVHFEALVNALTEQLGEPICYLTSSLTDPILSTTNRRIKAFYIGHGFFRTYLFYNLKTRLMVMTMPDLETFHVKRSRVYPVKYVYVFHSLVSTHMIYRPEAFHHFDVIFCSGSHHVREIRKAERLGNLTVKQIVEHGYGRLDEILAERTRRNLHEPSGTPHVLIAPTWGPDSLIETCGLPLIHLLLEAGMRVTLRPHPITYQKSRVAVEAVRKTFLEHVDFTLETDVGSQESFHSADIMISDWSGAALEFSFGLLKPVLFIDVPRKINNPSYETLEIEPLEVTIRDQIGEILSPSRLEEVVSRIETMCRDRKNLQRRVETAREETVFNLGKSGEVGATRLLGLLK